MDFLFPVNEALNPNDYVQNIRNYIDILLKILKDRSKKTLWRAVIKIQIQMGNHLEWLIS